MKHFVVNAPNYFVQPVTVTNDEDAAIAAAVQFTKNHNTHTEVWQFNDNGEGYVGVHRFTNEQGTKNLADAKTLLKKHFPQDHIQFEDFDIGLCHNPIGIPSRLSLHDARRLETLDFKLDLVSGHFEYRFYSHNFVWNR